MTVLQVLAFKLQLSTVSLDTHKTTARNTLLLIKVFPAVGYCVQGVALRLDQLDTIQG